jgi:hypothetical protein
VGLAQLYARLPPGMIRRRERTVITQLNISTPNLRKLLAMKDLDRDIKCKLYSILLYRRRAR